MSILDLDFKASTPNAGSNTQSRNAYPSDVQFGCPSLPEVSHVRAACSLIPPCKMK